MHMIARMCREPGADFRVFVRGVVVDDEMQMQRRRHTGVEMPQEREELLVTMARLTLRDDLTAAHLKRGEQRRGAMPVIVVRDPFEITQPHR